MGDAHSKHIRFIQVGGRCFYCDTPLVEFGTIKNPRRATWDHVVPRHRGGKSVPANLILCCGHCNRMKGSLKCSKFLELCCRIADTHRRTHPVQPGNPTPKGKQMEPFKPWCKVLGGGDSWRAEYEVVQGKKNHLSLEAENEDDAKQEAHDNTEVPIAEITVEYD